MELRSFVRAYARSPLGIGSFLAAVGIGFCARLLGLSALPTVLLGLGILVALAALGLAMGFGQRAAFAEVEREAGAKAASRLAEAAEARKRLAALRLIDPALASARDLLVLEAGRFVEDCGRANTYDPEAVQAIVDAPCLVDAWLKEADEGAVERRFGLSEHESFQAAEPKAAPKAAEALRAAAALVASRRASVLGEIGGADCITIEEELK
jgi:hypothetical protein